MLAQVLCEVSSGLRAQEATVKVRDYHGRPEFMPVDRSMLAQTGGRITSPCP